MLDCDSTAASRPHGKKWLNHWKSCCIGPPSLLLAQTTLEAVLGKFLAGMGVSRLAVLLSFPMAITVGYLGSPDWGVVATSYLGASSWPAAYLGVCSLTSALTKNQVISFVVSFLACAVLVFLGYSGFTGFLEGFLPVGVADAVSNFSFITHFNPMVEGHRGSEGRRVLPLAHGLHALPQRGRARTLKPTIRNDIRQARLSQSSSSSSGLVLVNYLATSVPVRARRDGREDLHAFARDQGAARKDHRADDARPLLLEPDERPVRRVQELRRARARDAAPVRARLGRARSAST